MTDTRMRIIFGLVAVMAISFLLIAFAKAQQSTIRDANGRSHYGDDRQQRYEDVS